MLGLTEKTAQLVGIDKKQLVKWSVQWRGLFPHTGFREHQRVPLAHPEVPFVLITSQKAGSTLGTAWFFHHAGLLMQAKSYNSFVHQYEQDVFLRTPGYFENLQEAVATKPVLKLVREPGARAFSSYLALHQKPAGDSANDHRDIIRRQIAKHIGVRFRQDMRMSLAAFLSWAAAADHRRMDGHEARQTNLYEDHLPLGRPEAIKLEDVATAFPEIEKRFGLRCSSQGELQEFGASTHYVEKHGNDALVDKIVTEGVELPRSQNQPIITTETLVPYERAHRHLITGYEEDYRRYGYSAFKP